MIEVNCVVCGKTLKRWAHEARNPDKIFCSHTCKGIHQTKHHVFTCLYCGKQFQHRKDAHKKIIYCSPECYKADRVKQEHIPAVYGVVHLPTERIYIGSTKHFYRRKIRHLWDLRMNRHYIAPLQEAWNADGEQAFEIRILEVVDDPSKLLEREQYWLDFFELNHPGKRLNTTSQAIAARGRKLSLEERQAISLAHQGMKHNAASRAKMSAQRKGSKSVTAKLTEQDIPTIRQRAADGESNSQIARSYGLHSTSVDRIIKGKTWAHVK